MSAARSIVREEDLEKRALEAELERYKSWMRRVAEASEAIAQGDLEVRILGCDDTGDIGRAVHGLNRLLDVTDAFVRESKATLDYASRGKFFRRVLLRGLPGTFRDAAVLINGATEKMKEQADALESARRERLDVADTFEQAIDAVVTVVATSATNLQETAGSLVAASSATTAQSAAVASAAQQMSSGVQSVASATEQLNASAQEIRRQVDGSTGLARSAVKEVESTKTVVADLGRASVEIGQVVKLINDIAKQSNLLALNATIEAARVGDAGKGFGVVAAEVKSLARQTSSATDKIAATVNAIQTASREGIDAIGRIDRAISGFEEAMSSIEASVREQRSANDEISKNVHQSAAGTREVSHNIGLVAEAAEDATRAANAVHHTASDVAAQAERLRSETRRLLAAIRGS